MQEFHEHFGQSKKPFISKWKLFSRFKTILIYFLIKVYKVIDVLIALHFSLTSEVYLSTLVKVNRLSFLSESCSAAQKLLVSKFSSRLV